MTFEDYLLEDVRPSEFRALKAKEGKILSEIVDSFNDEWKPRVKDIKATLKYNPKRNIIGIHLKINDRQCLIEGKEGLNEEEKTFVYSLYTDLMRKMSSLRLKREEWVDSI